MIYNVYQREVRQVFYKRYQLAVGPIPPEVVNTRVNEPWSTLWILSS